MRRCLSVHGILLACSNQCGVSGVWRTAGDWRQFPHQRSVDPRRWHGHQVPAQILHWAHTRRLQLQRDRSTGHYSVTSFAVVMWRWLFDAISSVLCVRCCDTVACRQYAAWRQRAGRLRRCAVDGCHQSINDLFHITAEGWISVGHGLGPSMGWVGLGWVETWLHDIFNIMKYSTVC